MQDTRVLVVTNTRPLMRVIEYLFYNQPNLRVVARSDNGDSLIRYAACLKPELIVTHDRLFGPQTANTVAEVRRSSPASKLILIGSCQHSSNQECESGADACLPEEALVRRLISVVQEILSFNGASHLKAGGER